MFQLAKVNFLEETIKALAENGKTLSDVEWWGTGKYAAKEAIESAFNFEYDQSEGREIPANLIVVGKDFWLERSESWVSGDEIWVFMKKPEKPDADQAEYDKQEMENLLLKTETTKTKTK